MRSQYQRALYQLVSVAREQDLPKTVQSVWPLSQPVGMDWSRYYREFQEIAFIAGGGFGRVYKARHKLDGINYAVKKITIKSTTINQIMTHLAEVKTLASLNHTNIVPYKAAWLEPIMCDPGGKTLLSGTTMDDGLTTMDEDEDEYSESILETKSRTWDHCGNTFSKVSEDESTDFIQFERSETDGQSFSRTSGAVCKYSVASEQAHVILNDSSQPHINLKWATLFIQMSLCQLTLREWLDNRNRCPNFEDFYEPFLESCQQLTPKSTREALLNFATNSHLHENTIFDATTKALPSQIDVAHEIFSQIINGLCYIHTRGIVHHDIKPSNVFIGIESNGDLLVQLGDFGLACPLQDQHSNVVVGTPTYAAPEQLKGHCDPKVSAVITPNLLIIDISFFIE